VGKLRFRTWGYLDHGLQTKEIFFRNSAVGVNLLKSVLEKSVVVTCDVEIAACPNGDTGFVELEAMLFDVENA
jgi:hypothetical protein